MTEKRSDGGAKALGAALEAVAERLDRLETELAELRRLRRRGLRAEALLPRPLRAALPAVAAGDGPRGRRPRGGAQGGRTTEAKGLTGGSSSAGPPWPQMAAAWAISVSVWRPKASVSPLAASLTT